MKHKHLFTFGAVMMVAWPLGTVLLVYLWPHFVNNIYKKAIVDQGFGKGPVPINTLYAEPPALFADPLHTALPPGSSKLMTVGVNHDTLLTVGWLDLSKGPLVLHVPNFSGRYYSVQCADPFDTAFAYVGTRATGTQAGDYLLVGPGWKGEVPSGMRQIASPNNSVLVIGRVLVYSDSDLWTAYNLARQIQLTPLRSAAGCLGLSPNQRGPSTRNRPSPQTTQAGQPFVLATRLRAPGQPATSIVRAGNAWVENAGGQSCRE
jgi:hypothetical protein